MNPKVYNPYLVLGDKQTASLDYIIAHLPPTPTFYELNEQLAASYFTANPQNPTTGDFISSYIGTILPHAYNGYVNSCRLTVVGCQSTANEQANGYWSYSDVQMHIIAEILKGIYTVPAESIGEFLGNVEEDIVSGRLRYEEQISLLLAVALGKSSNDYWMAQIATPGTWAAYLNADTAINYAQVAGWVSAAMQGVLLAYGLMKPPQLQPVDIITATIASTGITAGKVLFKWLPR